jgi:hypothetical protein
MAIFDIFSKRQRKVRGEVPDVFAYDDLPEALRVQIVHIWRDTLGGEDCMVIDGVRKAYEFIVGALRREYGVFVLPGNDEHGRVLPWTELYNFVLQEKDVERALDAVEISFRVINHITRAPDYMHRDDADKRASSAIEELNARFLEHGVGYQFADNKIVRVDSEFLHAEAVKPALRLLSQKQYAGAQQEFLAAHEHHRHGKTKEALNECLKAFESVMKSICAKRRWQHAENATAKDLIQACLENGLIPSFWQSHFTSLRSLLESGVPTGRNRLGGHGQGPTPTDVPDHLVAFMLHMTASAIVFLAEAEAELG